ncbi:biotin--[acetyl-CoA-carboxylase] ligase [Myxacorys almedinensis]|uniref:biotin--[acetyl-CoA-carboxylase] ligase n=1 Tax=Myxacorys almedinensis TaxID=2651157 RepID=UPI0030839CE3
MFLDRQRLEAALRVACECSTLPISADRLPAHPARKTAPKLYLFDAIASTNRTLWELIDQHSLPEGSLVLARQQHNGKGQWGRQWLSPPGGLYLSTVLYPNLPLEFSAHLTLCTAWGIAKALREIPGCLSGTTNKIAVGLKWLNDLVLNGRKLGGILTETRIQRDLTELSSAPRITKAVVGVGINWRNPVPEPGINLQSVLQEQPVPLIESLEMLAAIVTIGVLSGYQHWQQVGIGSLLPEYEALLINMGQSVKIADRLGTITGVSATGALRVQFPPQPNQVDEIFIKPGAISLEYG